MGVKVGSMIQGCIEILNDVHLSGVPLGID